jgi:anaerobic dimethyl sulfoxide reductase subunit A
MKRGEEMTKYIDRVKRKGLSRRNFVKTTAASAALVALAGCVPSASNTVTETPEDAVVKPDLVNGKWITAPCQMSCSTRCINKVYVVDGVPIRAKTDDTHPDSPNYPQQRGCVKGRANRQYITGADRFKYPMKRKSWQPGGGNNVHPELRGLDEWERISWDDALDMVAREFKRIKDVYGNLSLCSPVLKSLRVSNRYASIIFNAMGGCVTVWGQQSKGGFPVVGYAMKGAFDNEAQDRIALRKAKLLVFFAANPIWSASGSNTSYIRHAKDAGCKVITVDPWFSPSAQGIADQWIPVRPGTDAALLAAVAYYMIENNLQDQDFLDKYALGFDADHMPEGEEGNENFRDYILGKYDGTPKTPEWASEICGTDPDIIRDLAQQMGTAKPMAIKSGQAAARTYCGAQFAQMFYTVGWMTGNIGQLGGEVSGVAGQSGVQGGSGLVRLGANIFGKLAPKNTVCTEPRGGGNLEKGVYDESQYYGIAYAELWDAIITGSHTDFTRGMHDCNIKCISKMDIGAPMNQLINSNRMIEALRMKDKVEFIVTADFFMTTDCLFSDIILPASTMWEREGGFAEACGREALMVGSKVIEPYFESKEDWWIDQELAKRLGIDISVVNPPYPEADYPTRVATSTVIGTEGTDMEPLVTITQADIDKWHLDMEPQIGRITMDEIYEQGGYQFERQDNDAFMMTPHMSFIEDPIANPLATTTGKFEIFSRTLAERMDKFHSTPIEPIAKYVPAKEGYEETFSNWTNKIKGEYPFQMASPHVLRRAHCAYDNVKSLNEIFADACIMNAVDAEVLGLKTNDTALIASIHGKAIRRIQATNRIMPGVVLVGQGRWTDLDDKTGIDMNCNVNILTGGYLIGEGSCAYNTVCVKIEKYSGTPLDPDYKRPQRVMNF